MSVVQTPPPARSDLGPSDTTDTNHSATRPYRLHGTVLTAGALTWAAAIAAVGPDPVHQRLPLIVFGLGSGLFQIGALLLLRVLWRTRALQSRTGSGKVARSFLRIETVFLLLAIASTTVDAIGVSDLTKPGWLLLDFFWPISMLGMFAIGLRVAIAGRWKGLSRFWPIVAESWAVVTVPTMAIFGSDAARVVGSLHLLVGYAVLGRIVARKRPDGS
jgi:hypothetical protein